MTEQATEARDNRVQYRAMLAALNQAIDHLEPDRTYMLGMAYGPYGAYGEPAAQIFVNGGESMEAAARLAHSLNLPIVSDEIRGHTRFVAWRGEFGGYPAVVVNTNEPLPEACAMGKGLGSGSGACEGGTELVVNTDGRSGLACVRHAVAALTADPAARVTALAGVDGRALVDEVRRRAEFAWQQASRVKAADR